MAISQEQREVMSWRISLAILKQLKEWKAQSDRIPGAKVIVIPEYGETQYELTDILESEHSINLKYKQGNDRYELDIFRAEGDQLRYNRNRANAITFTSEGAHGEVFLDVPRSKISSEGAVPISISSLFGLDYEFEDDPDASDVAWSNTPFGTACGSVYSEFEKYLHLPDGLCKRDIADRLGMPKFTLPEHLSTDLQLSLKPHLDTAPINTQAVVCCPHDSPDNWIAVAFITLTEKRDRDAVRVDIALPEILTNPQVAQPGDIETSAAMLGWLISETVLSHMAREKEYYTLSQLNFYIVGDIEGEQSHIQRSFVHGCHFFIPFREWSVDYWELLQDEIDELPENPPFTKVTAPDYWRYVY